MPFLDPPDPITATLTDLGRINFARVANGEISFEVTSFAVGRGGYNVLNPVKITSINAGLTALEDHFFPASSGLKPVESLEYPTPKTCVANCRLASSEALAGLGEVGIWATIVYSATTPSEVGTNFMLAVAHTPMHTKTLRQVIVYRMIIQF